MPDDVHAADEFIDELLTAAMNRIRAVRALPESTYRLQLHAGFTFRAAAAIIPYLSSLGISHVYASPYLKAKPGSMHGYDVIDHCHLNPELGSAEDYDHFLAVLAAHGMSHIFDMVPNHVGVATNDNIWWNDVLENGPASIYATYFDINWEGSPHTDLRGRVLIPILGSMYGHELESGNLKLLFEPGGFFVAYHDRKFPISPRTYSLILAGNGPSPLSQLLSEFDRLPDRCQSAAAALQRHAKIKELKHRLAEAYSASQTVQNLIAKHIEAFNGTPGNPGSFDGLDHLLRHQCFRLACWRTAPDEVNYRRFFDVNDLAALRMEQPDVFRATHDFILHLLAQNKIAGIRVDHPDGLYDPETYFQRLQIYYVLAVAHEEARKSSDFRDDDWPKMEPLLLERLNRQFPSLGPQAPRWPLFVLGEKILALDEPLCETWPIDGTSGYEFLNMTGGLFVDSSSAEKISEIYHAWIQDDTPYDQIVYCKKKLVLEIGFASELNMLAIELKQIAQRSRYGVDYSLHGLNAALKEIIACFPVYRSYISPRGISGLDRRHIRRAADAAIRLNPKTEPSIFEFIAAVLLTEDGPPDELSARRHFAGKFQQLTSPATAKGIEDTTFYIYNRLLSLNEVGGDPSRFGVSPHELHVFFQNRRDQRPYSMSCLSTHDTKRSEDVRARLNVLSELPQTWAQCLERWGDLNAPHRATIDGQPAPDRNEEYALYQTLLGAWPMDLRQMDSFKQRIQFYMLKSMREAKVHTSWPDPNVQREAAVRSFIDAILDEARSGEFLADFLRFQMQISHCGMINSLSQTLIKLTAPGIPDNYQGAELWDFSLVDPDNRRPVDFAMPRRLMDEFSKSDAANHRNDLDSPQTGRTKLVVHQSALKARNQNPRLFTTGQYLPLQTGGSMSASVFAFARHDAGRIAVTAVPRLISSRLISSRIDTPGRWPCGSEFWSDTHVIFPPMAAGRKFRNVFTGRILSLDKPNVPLAAELFADWPLALLLAE